MSYSEIRRVKACRNAKCCDWCGELIEIGQPKAVWFCYDEAVSCHVHPECLTPVQTRDRIYDDDGFTCGDNPRGCNCKFMPNCECGWEARKKAKTTTDTGEADKTPQRALNVPRMED